MTIALSINALTTLQDVKDELGLTDAVAARDDLLIRYINSASDAAERIANRSFYYEAAREESVAGFGGSSLLVAKAPLLAIASITSDSILIAATAYEIKRASIGSIYRIAGNWGWTAKTIESNIVPSALPGSERKTYEVTYEGGWVTPEQVRSGSVTAVADAGGGNVTMSSVLHRLVAGGTVVHSEFADANYNGTLEIVSVTADTYVVTATWGATGTGTFTKNGWTRTLPYDLENAVISLVTTRYRARGRDETIKSEKLMSYSVTYNGQQIPESISSVFESYGRIGE